MDWTGIHPDLAIKMQRVYAAMSALGFPMRGLEGLRSTARQQELYARGRSAPGAIVTRADGVTTLSMHQVQADGFGHAVDSAFLGAEPWTGPWDTYGSCAKALGLKWGGDFTAPDPEKPGHVLPNPDRPHVESAVTAVQTSRQSSASTSPT